MKPKIYLETSVISYLTSRSSRDLIVAANQQLTQEWWQVRRQDFDSFISQLVIQEASAGDEDAAQRRLQAIVDIPLLKLNEEAVAFAKKMVEEGFMPPGSLGLCMADSPRGEFFHHGLVSTACSHYAQLALIFFYFFA